MTFSELLKRLLEIKGLEQKDLAQRAGTSPSVITDTMKGRLRPPLKKIESWADALDLHGDHRAEFILHAHLAHAPDYVRKYIETLEGEISNLSQDVKEVRSLIAEKEQHFELRVAEAIEQYKPKPPPMPEAWPMPNERSYSVVFNASLTPPKLEDFPKPEEPTSKPVKISPLNRPPSAESLESTKERVKST